MVLLQIDDGLRLELRVEIPGQLKQPEVGCSTLSAEILDTFFSIPVGAALPFRSHTSFDLQGVVVKPTDSAHDISIPCIAVQGAHSTQDMIAAEAYAALRGEDTWAFGTRGVHSYPRPMPTVGDFAVPPFCKHSC